MNEYEIINIISKWLEENESFSFDKDKDGFWFEDCPNEIKFKDWYEIMFKFVKQAFNAGQDIGAQYVPNADMLGVGQIKLFSKYRDYQAFLESIA